MQRLAGVLFQVGVVDANPFGGVVIQGNLNVASTHNGMIHLAGLVTLGKIRVEVVFAVKHRDFRNLSVDGEAKLHGHGDGLLIQYWQDARQAQINGAGLGVRLGAKRSGGAGKDLRARCELNVNFQPNHGFPLH